MPVPPSDAPALPAVALSWAPFAPTLVASSPGPLAPRPVQPDTPAPRLGTSVASLDSRPRQSELAVGLGIRPGTSAERILTALREVVGDKPIACIATIDRRAEELGLHVAATQLGVQVRAYTAAELARVAVPTPSTRIAAALGTASVAEAAALLAADGPLVIPKRTVDGIVLAAALVPRRIAECQGRVGPSSIGSDSGPMVKNEGE